MVPAQRIASFWNWLPAFRAVAEAEHLPSAAERCHVSASALSRTVKLLEDEVGAPLFTRVGRRIVLNERGRVLLSAARDAMRRVDDGYRLILPHTFGGRVRLSGHGTHRWVMNEAVTRMRHEHPQLVPVLRTLDDRAVAAALREGALDVALMDAPSPAEDIVLERLNSIQYGIYCGKSHALYEQPDAAPSVVLEHAFVVPSRDVNDNWPPEIQRRIGAEVDAIDSGIALAEGGTLLALLPGPVAAASVSRGSLRQLAWQPADALPLYAAYRRPVGEHPVTTYVLEVVRGVTR